MVRDASCFVLQFEQSVSPVQPVNLPTVEKHRNEFTRTYQNIYLPAQHILRLLKCIRSRPRGPSDDLVEAGSNVSGRVDRLRSDGVEIGCGSVLALGERDEFVAGAFDDGEGDDVGRHYHRR